MAKKETWIVWATSYRKRSLYAFGKERGFVINKDTVHEWWQGVRTSLYGSYDSFLYAYPVAYQCLSEEIAAEIRSWHEPAGDIRFMVKQSDQPPSDELFVTNQSVSVLA